MNIVIVSGYFNPVHRGHIRLLRQARQLGDKLIVIVNNDVQQRLKKGKIIMSEAERMEVVSAMRDVDEVVLSVDQDRTVCRTLELVAGRYAGSRIIFANGGDRSSTREIPETAVCEQHGIVMRFGVGGGDKPQSSSNINQALGLER
ncbi:MAG: adenylyltransferase/cytidyltransferase family protein [Candidatus Kerfeldbacteria bacterium]|nr:adenylyltransferase/cytidyltransferase family protein [Candidatus Kerfeldbacteria bacterium]